MRQPPVAVIVVAAGAGVRFGGDKLTARLGGVPVLERAVQAMRAALPEAPLALVVRPEQVEEARASWESRGVLVAAGGPRRQESVRNGIEALHLGDDAVAVIHDAARPFVPVRDVLAVVAAAVDCGAAVLVAPVADTVKELGEGARIVRTVPREQLARALTPQAFRVGVLRRSWANASTPQWTDEAALVESAGGQVIGVRGDPRNLKITTPEDLLLLEGLFPPVTRVGQGVDVHPFGAGRRLVLCGVEIPGEPGLAGHSDADAPLHAVTDAILGACAAGDIGQYFPPSEERWRDAPSDLFVRHAVGVAAVRGLAVAHCDVTILAERPHIAPFREAMRARLAEMLCVDVSCVGVKATTCEGLGFIGRREGLMAMAIVTLAPA